MPRCRLILLSLCVALAGRGRAVAAVTMTVSPAGDVAIQLDGRPVATGTWHLRPDSYLPPTGSASFDPGPVVSAVGAQDGPGHATLHEQHAAARADYTLDLTGEDLRIAAHVVNTDVARTLKSIAFNGLTFHFNPTGPVTGQMQTWHWTYLQHEGIVLFHPSTLSPIGCWWAADDRFGFSAFSDSEFDRAALVTAAWANRDNALSPECAPNFYTERSVPPGGVADVTLTFRITPDRSMAHLMGAYKAVYDRHFPLPMETPDARGIAASSNVDQRHVAPLNPFGYQADWYRFDTAWGTAAYLRRFLPPLRRAGFIGTIFWSPGGYDPPMYPPDFDAFPPAVQANLPALVKGFHDQGLRIGLCARPGDGVRRPPGAEPTVYRLSADDPEQMRVGMGRFRHAMSMGFDMFYLDSIGGLGVNDVRIIRQIRDTVGPDVLLYSEHGTDMSLPYADRYCEWRDGGIQWDGEPLHSALRLLCPRATWLCISRTRQVIPPAFARLALTPLVADQDLGRVPPAADRP